MKGDVQILGEVRHRLDGHGQVNQKRLKPDQVTFSKDTTTCGTMKQLELGDESSTSFQSAHMHELRSRCIPRPIASFLSGIFSAMWVELFQNDFKFKSRLAMCHRNWGTASEQSAVVSLGAAKGSDMDYNAQWNRKFTGLPSSPNTYL